MSLFVYTLYGIKPEWLPEAPEITPPPPVVVEKTPRQIMNMNNPDWKDAIMESAKKRAEAVKKAYIKAVGKGPTDLIVIAEKIGVGRKSARAYLTRNTDLFKRHEVSRRWHSDKWSVIK